jgi:hypothetical protein
VTRFTLVVSLLVKILKLTGLTFVDSAKAGKLDETCRSELNFAQKPVFPLL